MSEVDGGGMAVEAEPSHQYPVTFCCHATDGSRGGDQAEWCLPWKCMWSKGGCHWILLSRKKWHPLTFVDACWTFVKTKQWMQRSEVVVVPFQQWWHRCERQATFQTAMQIFTSLTCRLLFICWQKCIANGHVCIKKWYFVAENLLYQTVLLCSLYLLKFLLEINRRHYFQSNLRTFFVKTIEECFHRITDPHASLASPSTSQFSVVNTYFCSYIWC